MSSTTNQAASITPTFRCQPSASGTGHVTIVGGGIGGVALGIALQQRGIRYTLFEKDDCFDSRRQGYGLTMQVSLV